MVSGQRCTPSTGFLSKATAPAYAEAVRTGGTHAWISHQEHVWTAGNDCRRLSGWISSAEAGERCQLQLRLGEQCGRRFTKGEEETHAGAAHPHYVACLNGQIYCCVDDSRGQNCDAVESKTRATSSDWMKAVLAAHRAQAKKMSPSGKSLSRQP